MRQHDGRALADDVEDDGHERDKCDECPRPDGQCGQAVLRSQGTVPLPADETIDEQEDDDAADRESQRSRDAGNGEAEPDEGHRGHGRSGRLDDHGTGHPASTARAIGSQVPNWLRRHHGFEGLRHNEPSFERSTIKRATMLIPSVVTKSTKPSKIRALFVMTEEATKFSVISAAIDPRPPGPMSAEVRWLPCERTRTTIMVSPSPRPTPRRTAPRMPLREKGRMTSVTIPQRVPPRPSAASQTSRGVSALPSRLTEVMIGMIVTQQINPQAKIDFTYWFGAAVRNIGTKLACATSHRAGAA